MQTLPIFGGETESEMSNYLIYSSPAYSVFRRGPGVLITQLATNEAEWLQGDEAVQLEEQLEAYGTTEEIGKHLLSPYFD